MASSQLEMDLIEAGNSLLHPPSSTEELLVLLDQSEHLLMNVEQSPPKSVEGALFPLTKALIAAQLLESSDMDIKMSVTSCITELMRITAPEPPYNDNVMKEVFQLFVQAFGSLSDMSAHRTYNKAASILHEAAKVRACAIMMDLELDELLIEMFQQFLKNIRSDHPRAVLMDMESIMTQVLEEIEEISFDLLHSLLACLKKDNQDFSPASWKLGEKVVRNCAAKLKPYIMKAVQSAAISLDDYVQVVTAVCENGSISNEDHVNGSGEHVVTQADEVHEHNLERNTNQSEQSQGTKESALGDCGPKEISLAVDGVTKSTMGNGTSGSAKVIKSENDPETARTKRSWKPNTLMNPEEGYEHHWESSRRRKSQNCSLPEGSHRRRGRPKKNQAMSIQEGSKAQVKEKTPESADVCIKKERDDTCYMEPRLDSSIKDGLLLEDAPKRKRKRTAETEKVSVMADLDDQLLGKKIKVWWPLDETFYEGIVHAFDPEEKKHKVLYTDGEEENLDLRSERWELIVDDISPDGEQEADLPKPDASSYIPRRRKRSKKSSSTEVAKAGSSSKRGRPSARKPKVDTEPNHPVIDAKVDDQKSTVTGSKPTTPATVIVCGVASPQDVGRYDHNGMAENSNHLVDQSEGGQTTPCSGK